MGERFKQTIFVNGLIHNANQDILMVRRLATASREQMDKRLSQRDWTPVYANYELDAG